MGSIKQAESIVSLHHSLGNKSWYLEPANPVESERRLYDQVIASDNASIQNEFARINKATGFDRKSNPATDAQVLLIAKLEKKIFGKPVTATWTMRYSDADVRIKALKIRADMDDKLAEVPKLPTANTAAITFTRVTQ